MKNHNYILCICSGQLEYSLSRWDKSLVDRFLEVAFPQLQYLPEKTKESLVFKAYYRRGYNISFNILHNKPFSHEAVCTAFLKIHAVPYVPEGDFNAYFDTTVRSCAYDIFRRRKTEKIHQERYKYRRLNMMESSKEQQIKMAKIGAVRRAIKMLDEPQQSLMWAKYIEEKEVSEIAEESSVTKRAVEAHLYRGKKKLANILSKLLNPIYDAA